MVVRAELSPTLVLCRGPPVVRRQLFRLFDPKRPYFVNSDILQAIAYASYQLLSKRGLYW